MSATVTPPQPTSTLEYQGPWRHPDGVLDLMGQPLPADRFFFVPPPPEIGPVTSAWSTVREGSPPRPWWLKAALVLGIAIGAGYAAHLALGNQRGRQADQELGAMAGIIAVALVGLFFAVRQRNRCTYVGAEGIARFRWGKRRGEVLRFPDADHLITSQTRHYTNGVYTGTSYHFAWFGPDGRRLMRVNGTYYDRKGKAKPNSDYNFALTSELAWSNHYVDRAVAQLNHRGFAQFNTNRKGHAIRVLPGAIEFIVKGETVRLTPAEIKKLELSSGHLVAHHKDAKWYSGNGKFSFPYGGIANARVMLLLLEKLVGYRVS